MTDVVRNAGRTTAPPSTTGYYLSRDRDRGPSDVRLGRRHVGGLQPGGTSRRSETVRVPSSAVLGSYHVLACADDRHRVRESVELNNCRSSAAGLDVTTPNGHSPVFAGLEQATTCIPGPIGKGRSSSYRLSWKSASDNVTPAGAIVYDIYQATKSGGEDFSSRIAAHLDDAGVELVAMAGFIRRWRIPPRYRGKVMNIHPALLPAFKGWHAVRDSLAAGVKVTGCTVHLATLEVDEGPILAQETVPVLPDDTEATLHERIKDVERCIYPEVVRRLLESDA